MPWQAIRRVILILILAGLGASAVASPISLDDISRLQRVAAVAISPDGKHIAFVRERPRDPFKDDNGPAWTELMVRVNGAEERPYMTGAVNVSQVRWNDQGSGLYFLGKTEGADHNALYAMPVDGGGARVICQLSDRSIASFDVHADSRLALVLDVAETAAEKLMKERGFDALVYEESARQNELAVAEISVDGDCQPKPLSAPGHVSEVSFSADGRHILTKVAPTPLVDDGLMQTRLQVLDLEGAEASRIDNLGKLGQAVWSPDGSHVAYIGVNDFNDPAAGRLKVANASSGTIRTLLYGLEGHVMEIAWAGNDTLLALVHIGLESELWEVQLDSEEYQALITQGDVVVSAVSASDDGQAVALVGSSAQHPGELFQWHRGSLQRLTDSNPWLAERSLGQQRGINYSASDGLALQGVVVYPVDYDSSRQYPLVIFVHGGPEAHRSDAWLTSYSSPIQVLAGQGYVSFVPNYRGSTGRGVDFSKLGQHAYATPEFDDIVDGKNHLVSLGLVDADKVGITGGSYGGYATGWSATALSEHYAAGVMFVGISNQISKFGTSDIPREMHAVHARAWPWENWQFMLERSPIYHVQKSKTPLLIMHGDSDPRVHPSQSLELYRYLKLAGQAPVRLVWYPGEGHGNRKAAARYDYSVRLLRWMNHYLSGPGGEPPPYLVDYSERLNSKEGQSDE